MIPLPEFTVSDVKTRISSQHNEEFADFWKTCNENGLTERLKKALSVRKWRHLCIGFPQAAIHDHRPEIEVYPKRAGVYVEFWLPVIKE